MKRMLVPKKGHRQMLCASWQGSQVGTGQCNDENNLNPEGHRSLPALEHSVLCPTGCTHTSVLCPLGTSAVDTTGSAAQADLDPKPDSSIHHLQDLT